MSEFTTFEEYPKVRYHPLGNSGVNIVLGNEFHQVRTNVEDTIDAVKQYKRVYNNSCKIVNESYFDVEEYVCTHEYYNCVCLEDAYDELVSMLSPYKRWNLEGVLERDNEGNFFLNGRNTPIPNSLADLVIDYQENGFDTQPLCNFWDKVLANPDPDVRDQIMSYIDKYGITITNNGDMILYKVVTIREEALDDSEFVGFVSSEYMKRKDWGKNPKDYYVYDLNEKVVLPNNHTAGPGYYVSSMEEEKFKSSVSFNYLDVRKSQEENNTVEYLGTLDEVFNNLDSLKSEDVRSVYTDKYSRTLDYDLGVVQSMPRDKCDSNPENACSDGLHVGAKEYIDWYRNDYPEAQEHIQACLVSPEHVVCIPNDHNMAKIRTCEFLPYAIMEVEVDDNDRTIWKEIEGSFFDVEYTPWDVDDVEKRIDDLYEEFYEAEGEEKELLDDQIEVLESRLVEL